MVMVRPCGMVTVPSTQGRPATGRVRSCWRVPWTHMAVLVFPVPVLPDNRDAAIGPCVSGRLVCPGDRVAGQDRCHLREHLDTPNGHVIDDVVGHHDRIRPRHRRRVQEHRHGSCLRARPTRAGRADTGQMPELAVGDPDRPVNNRHGRVDQAHAHPGAVLHPDPVEVDHPTIHRDAGPARRPTVCWRCRRRWCPHRRVSSRSEVNATGAVGGALRRSDVPSTSRRPGMFQLVCVALIGGAGLDGQGPVPAGMVTRAGEHAGQACHWQGGPGPAKNPRVRTRSAPRPCWWWRRSPVAAVTAGVAAVGAAWRTRRRLSRWPRRRSSPVPADGGRRSGRRAATSSVPVVGAAIGGVRRRRRGARVLGARSAIGGGLVDARPTRGWACGYWSDAGTRCW